MGLARRPHLEQQPPLDEQAAPVLAHIVPHPDRLGRVVLPQHLHSAPLRGEFGERAAVGAALDHVATLVGRAEEARVSRNLGALPKGELAVEAAELGLERAERPNNLLHRTFPQETEIDRSP